MSQGYTSSTTAALHSRNSSPTWSAVAPLAGTPPSGLIAAPAGTFPAPDPRAYAMEITGTCLAPDVASGSIAAISPAAALTRGGLVALHFRDGRSPQIKRLASVPPSPLLAALGKVGSNITGLVLVEALNPYRLLSHRLAELLAVHAVVEIIRPEHVQGRRSAVAATSGAASAA